MFAAEIRDAIGTYTKLKDEGRKDAKSERDDDLAEAKAGQLDSSSQLMGQKVKDLQDPILRQHRLRLGDATAKNAETRAGMLEQSRLRMVENAERRAAEDARLRGTGVPVQPGAPAPAAVDPNAFRVPVAPPTAIPQAPPMAGGGVVKGYQEGGLVDDDDDPNAAPDDDEDDGQGDADTAEMYGTVSANAGVDEDDIYTHGLTAARAGLSGLGGTSGATRGVASRSSRGGKDEEPIITAEERRQINPDGKLSRAQENMMLMGAAWKRFTDGGQPKKATQAAEALNRDYYRWAKTYSSVAAKAVEDGDLEGAASAMMKAYDYVPNGTNLRAQATQDKDGNPAVHFEILDDKTGKPIGQRIMTPDEIHKMATGFSHKEFREDVLHADEHRAGGKGKGAIPDKPMRLGDRAKAGEMVGPEVDKQMEGYDKEAAVSDPLQMKAAARLGDDENIPGDTSGSSEVKHIAAQVFAANSASKGVVTNMVMKLAGTSKPSDEFKVEPMESGGAKVTDKTGNVITLPKDAMRQLAVLRASNNNTVMGKIDKKDEDLRQRIKPEIGMVEGRRKSLEQRAPAAKRLRSPGREMARQSRSSAIPEPRTSQAYTPGYEE